MTAPAIDLLLRVVGERLETERCERCDEPASGSRITVREHTAERFVLQVRCPRCGHLSELRIEPDSPVE